VPVGSYGEFALAEMQSLHVEARSLPKKRDGLAKAPPAATGVGAPGFDGWRPYLMAFQALTAS
jgi:hypothetical protein